MPRIVIDTTVLVSAFLKPVPGGASYDLLGHVAAGDCELYLSDDILEEQLVFCCAKVMSDVATNIPMRQSWNIAGVSPTWLRSFMTCRTSARFETLRMTSFWLARSPPSRTT